MSSLNQEEFNRYYQAGKYAFECGKYRFSIENLEQAIKFININSRLGGEAQMWLVNAYQAGGKDKEAIVLCEELITHPHPEIRMQSKNLLYIINAPVLKRPKKWMSEIPDFNSLSNNSAPSISTNKKKSIKPRSHIEPVDLTKVNTKDNQFIFLGLCLTLIIILFYFG